jgi:hypothetical protein
MLRLEPRKPRREIAAEKIERDTKTHEARE